MSEVASNLPSKLASTIEGVLHDKVNQLQPMADQLGVVPAYFRRLLALGGASMVVLLFLFVYFTSDGGLAGSGSGMLCSLHLAYSAVRSGASKDKESASLDRGTERAS